MPNPHQRDSNATGRYPNLSEMPGLSSTVNSKAISQRRDDIPNNYNAVPRRRAYSGLVDSNAAQSWANLDEIAATSPVENPNESPVYHHTSLEEVRGQERGSREEEGRQPSHQREEEPRPLGDLPTGEEPSRSATQLYIHSHLIFFSIIGTLARKGLATLTTYPNTPITFDTIWVNFAGCLIMGFLVEDRKLFLHEWGSPTYHQQIAMVKQRQRDEESGASSDHELIDLEAAKKTFLSTKKGIPLYIGLTTGFCGSFTTFSEFVLDVFLALSNNLPSTSATQNIDRNGGDSFMALVGVTLLTVSLSLSGVVAGAHLAVSLEGSMPSLPYWFTRKVFDRLVVFLGWGSWIGAIMICAFPPHDFWRGRMAFALVFAPVGVLTRFYLALSLNGKSTTFPIGTFLANVLSSAVLASAWDMSHAAVGRVIGCQVLQGIQEGFCGCLSTVSTWVVELTSLRRKHSYIYGSVSVLVSLAAVVTIAGGENWSRGTQELLCST